MLRYESFIEVDAPVEFVFDMLADFERYPSWMAAVREVRRTGRRTTHWVAETALDVDVEWDAETTVFNPDHRIVWRAFRGDIHADGEAVLAQTERGTTVLRYVLGYDTPAGRSGERASQFFGEHPLRRLERDLARFKRVAEREASGHRGLPFAQPADDRRRATREERGSREDSRRGGSGRQAEDRGGWGFEEIQRRQRGRDERGEGPRRESYGRGRDGEREGRERGDGRDGRGRESLPGGRGTEGVRGARERDDVRERREGSRDVLGREGARERHEREGRRERNEREGRRGEREDVRDGRELDRARYSLLGPPERSRGRDDEDERGREERRGYGEDWFGRRGVDHLLDEPPSRRWRR